VRRRGLKGRLGCYLHDMTYENKREKDRERDDDDGGVCLGVRALVFVETIPLINSQLSWEGDEVVFLFLFLFYRCGVWSVVFYCYTTCLVCCAFLVNALGLAFTTNSKKD
jgi:hypothetical protein